MIKKDVKNMSINYNAKMGLDAICNLHKVNPDGGGYAMLGFTFHSADSDDAIKMLKEIDAFLVGANELGWTEFRPEPSGTSAAKMAAASNDKIPNEPERVPIDDRSEHYLLDVFNDYYDGELSRLPAWETWISDSRRLSTLGRQAYAGELNLHEHAGEIEQLLRTYEQLGRELDARIVISCADPGQ